MSKILVCDYCKKPVDKKDIKDRITSEQKKKTYDLCVSCEKALIGRLDALELPKPRRTVDMSENIDGEKIQRPENREEFIDAIEDGKEIVEEDVPKPRKRTRGKGPEVLTSKDTNDGKCGHYNKGRLKGIKSDQPYRQCRDCGEKFPFKGNDALDMKLPKGVKITEKKEG